MDLPDNCRAGCDLVSLADIDESIESFGEKFLRRVFTDGELKYCNGTQQRQRLAARFAAKEAVVKALALPDIPTPLREIEVVNDADGPPRVVLHGSIAAAATGQNWASISISLSHTDCHAMAVVAVMIDNSGRIHQRSE
jgi:holo-[acyl-carrier protein] synthase